MTKLVDDVARAIKGKNPVEHLRHLKTEDWHPEARAAIAVFARWLEEMNQQSDGDIDFIKFALASHLEEQTHER